MESSPKTPSKRKLTSTERALAESEELVKSLGGSTEGGRRTRSSARGVSSTPTPPPPPKKPRVSTPRRGRKAKDADEEPAEAESNNDAEVKELVRRFFEIAHHCSFFLPLLFPIFNQQVESTKTADITESKDTAEAAATNNSIDEVAGSDATEEKMEVDAATVESTTGTEEVAEVVPPAAAAESDKPDSVAEEVPVADSTDKAEPEVPVAVETAAAVETPAVEAVEAVPAAAQPVPTVEITPAVEVPTPAAEITPPVPVDAAPIATTEVQPSAPAPPEESVAVPVPEEVPVQIAEATPVVQAEPEPVVVVSNNRNGEVATEANSQPVDQKPAAIDSSIKLDIVASKYPKYNYPPQLPRLSTELILQPSLFSPNLVLLPLSFQMPSQQSNQWKQYQRQMQMCKRFTSEQQFHMDFFTITIFTLISMNQEHKTIFILAF